MADRIATVVALTLAYLAVSFPLFPHLGQATAALALVPAAVTGALFGLWAGAIAGFLATMVVTAQMIPFGLMDATRAGEVAVGVVGFVMIGAIAGRVRDLEERVRAQAQQLERELQRRSEYTDVVAHELRNPLVAMRTSARAALRNAGEPEGRADPRLDAIADEAGRALALLDGLNDVSSIESGRMRSVLRPVDLVAAVRAAAGVLGDLEERISLRLPDEPMLARADASRIEQVLLNLLTNAAKYSPASSPIDIQVGFTADREGVIVQVRDYGAGIPPSERGRLFERFARLSTAAGTSGSGLGLYICRGIIRDHGGELVANWPAGGGTMFSFTLPRIIERRGRPR